MISYESQMDWRSEVYAGQVQEVDQLILIILYNS